MGCSSYPTAPFEVPAAVARTPQLTHFTAAQPHRCTGSSAGRLAGDVRRHCPTQRSQLRRGERTRIGLHQALNAAGCTEAWRCPVCSRRPRIRSLWRCPAGASALQGSAGSAGHMWPAGGETPSPYLLSVSVTGSWDPSKPQASQLARSIANC